MDGGRGARAVSCPAFEEIALPEVIRNAASTADFDAFGGLVAEYVQWCRQRYQDHAWIVEQVFGYQSLETELQALATSYAPPNGQTLLAVRDGQVCGAGAWRRLADGSCEMKRLFVSDRFKGHGTGRRLCEALIASARAEGFALMRLDTGNLLAEAIAMYKSFGFRECAPHIAYPAALMPWLVFMELPLVDAAVRPVPGSLA
jgi:ribosomal protein S18 acetylase RimI-like enzyme